MGLRARDMVGAAVIDPGVSVLVLAAVALAAFYLAPLAWRRAAGGLAVLLTVIMMALQLLGAL